VSVLVLHFYTSDQVRIENWADGLASTTPDLWFWELDTVHSYPPGLVIEGQPNLTPIFDVLLGFEKPEGLSRFLSRNDWRADYDAICA
jgi:hypothetical protein